MSRFSERYGFNPPPTDLDERAMPDSLRNGLWDAIRLFFLRYNPDDYSLGGVNAQQKRIKNLANQVWFHFLRLPMDTVPNYPDGITKELRQRYYRMSFSDLYDFVEFLARLSPTLDEVGHKTSLGFTTFCNDILERERSVFRFADNVLVRVSDEESLKEIGAAIAQDQSVAVREHIGRAAEMYGQRPSPDYRNSIKEAVPAVEAAVSFVTGGKPDGVSRPLRKVFEQFPVHPALRDGFEKLYAYTSDAEGIRHALMQESNLTQEDARYMLVSCSAFANYLLALKTKR